MNIQVHNTATQTLKQWLDEYFPNPIKWKGAQGTAVCPFHDDRNPSFSVNAEKGVWQCFAGCGSGTLRQLAEALGVPAPPPVEFMREKERKRQTGMQPKRKTWTHEVEYIYTDAQGNPVLMVGRDGHGKNKRIRQYHFKDGEWWAGKGDTKPVPYNLPHVLVAIANGETVFVVEGEKDAETLWDCDLVATTNAGGAGKWPASKEFNRHFQGAKVVILPDNDEAGARHAEQVAHALKPFAVSIKVVNLPGLPEHGDVTDWLNAGHTSQKLLELVEQAGEWQPAPDKLVVLEGEKSNWLEIRRKYFDGGRFVPPLLAEDILQRQPFMFYGQQLYAYVDGVYVPRGRELVFKWCIDLLGTEYRQHRGNEVLHYIEKKTVVDEAAVNPEDGLINVKNGLLNWRTGELLPHTPERLSTIQLPVVYDPQAVAPRVERFMSEVLPHDAIPTILEFIGYCLVPHVRYEKAMMFTGTGANGKSVMIKLIQALIGKENTVSIPLQELADSRWKRADLHGKLLNAFADISHKAAETSMYFKAIVSGDVIDAERKGRDPFYFRPFAKILFSANELPASRDVTDGYFRRWLVVPFPNKFESKNRDEKLIDKLTTEEELSGLLNLAIEGLKRLETQGGFTENEATRQALAAYRRNIDSVAGFVEECCLLDEGASVGKQELFNFYRQWCEAAGMKPLGRNRFNQRLAEVAGVREGGNYRNVRQWRGISLLKDVEPYTQERERQVIEF